MGDFRADIKIKMESLGKTYKMDSWLNYFPDSECDGVDQRVIDFFRESWEDIRERHDEIIYKSQTKQREAEEKEHELAELERLKNKYEKDITPIEPIEQGGKKE